EGAIEIYFYVLDHPPHSPAGYRLHGRHAAWPRLGGVDARQMHGHHLGERIDVKPVFGGPVAQGGRDRNRKLLEHRIENREARNEFCVSHVAVVDLTDRGLIHRAAQVDLQNLRVAVMLPASRGFTWS